ncbi:MAG: MATE family efflux transporter, partial [Bilophila wadsworthia]
PVGYTLGRTHLWGDPLGPQGFWTAFIVGVSIAAVLLVIRVRVLERRLLSGFDRIRVMEG